MSLKTFHVIFIVASTLLAFGFGGWSLHNYFSTARAPLDLVFGLLSILVGLGLIWYGKYFLKKLKNISYL
ncbi:MAG: hypothetical protein M3Y82_12525 [Verrucomicrobiota bacterium]|nr:hypothetical protein [Verrucomicrobiota bacterium]